MNTASDAPALAQAVLRGEVRAAARLITRIERGDPAVQAALAVLHAQGGRTPVFGITGPPGAGKSTLVDQLIAHLRAAGLRVGVLAVDPSSPFTGGAILGDRVRMGRHSTDPGVFIRSMAARGSLGGLATAAGDTLLVLDAMGWDVVLVETVGVGQSEIDILRYAGTVILMQTPAGGDVMQAVKAGVIEVGDLFVLNKADVPGAERAASALREAIEFRTHGLPADAWRTPLLQTQAADGVGIDALWEAMQAHRAHLAAHPDQAAARQRRQVRAQIGAHVAEMLRSASRMPGAGDGRLNALVEQVLARQCDPMTAAQRLLAGTRAP